MYLEESLNAQAVVGVEQGGIVVAPEETKSRGANWRGEVFRGKMVEDVGVEMRL